VITIPWRSLVTILLGFFAGSWVAWQWQKNTFERQLAEQASAYRRDREQAAAAVITLHETHRRQRHALENRLQASDEHHYKEISDAQKNQARLRDQLATADVRLSVLLDGAGISVRSVPATSGAGSMVHDAARAELAPAHAQRIVGITDDGDQGLIALKACQAYIKDVTAAP